MLGLEPPGAGLQIAEDQAGGVVEVEACAGDAPDGGVEVLPVAAGEVGGAGAVGGDVGFGGEELQAQLVGAHLQGEDADGLVQLDGDVAGDVEGEGGLAHSGPSGEDVEASAQEAGAKAVPIGIAGREPYQGLGMAVFDGDQEAVEDGAGFFPADAGSAAEEVIGGVSETGEQLGDRTRGADGFQDRLPDVGDQVAPDAPLADDLGVFGDPADVGQVEVEGGEPGDTADGCQRAGLLEVGLEGEGVGRGAGVGNVEEGLVEQAVALDVPVARLKARADAGEVCGLQEQGAQDGALGFFAMRCHQRALLRRMSSVPSSPSWIWRPESQRERNGGGAAGSGPTRSSERSWGVTMVGRPLSSRVRVIRRRRPVYQSAAGPVSGSSRTRREVERRGAMTSSALLKSRWMRRDNSGPEIHRPRFPVRRCSARRTVARPVLPVPVGPQMASQWGTPAQLSTVAGQGRWKQADQLWRVSFR